MPDRRDWLAIEAPLLARDRLGWPDFSRRAFLRATTGAVLLGSSASGRAQLQPLIKSDDLSFLVVGDWGRNGKAYQPHVAARMAEAADLANARFTISTGDNFYNLGVSSPHASQWQTSFEDIYRHPALQHPWYPVLGNHDYGGDVQAQLARRKSAPRWQMRDRWFELTSSDHGCKDLHLFLIDTVLWIGKESFPYAWLGSRIEAEDAAEQRRWLTQALARSEAKHKLVFGHHPIYSVGPHGGREPKRQMRELDALLRVHNVTAYVCGHDHCLYAIEHKGMHYVCSGGGSEELQRYRGHPAQYGCVLPTACPDDAPQWYSYVDRAGFALFHVDQDALRFSFVDRAGLMSPATSLSPPGVARTNKVPVHG